MINKEKLMAIRELKLSDRIDQMDQGMLDDYTMMLDAFVESFPVYENRLKDALAGRDNDSLSRILMIIHESLNKIYAADLAQSCLKLAGDITDSKHEVIEAYLNAFLTTVSAFSIDIQMAGCREEQAPQEPKPVPSGAQDEERQKMILVVDDSPMSLNLMKSALQSARYKFVGLTSGTAALKFLQNNSPDLFVLDIEMPEMDGYELAGRIKDKGHSAPIIFLTGNSSKEYVFKAIQAGASDFIVKPVIRESMLEKISKYIG